MKTYETPWLTGSLLICNKCGKSFGEPDNAEKLKSELKGYLKESENHKKIRVMVSGCLNICQNEEQAVVFNPAEGKTQAFTVGPNYKSAIGELKDFLNKKL